VRRAAAAALAAALLLTGCTHGDDQPKRTTETRFLDALSTAIKGVNAARQRLADDANALATAADALDAFDDVAVEANREAARARRPKADNAMAKASAAARRLTKDVRAYATAITALDRAPKDGLDTVQRGAVDDVVTATGAEQAQLKGYATVVAAVWPRYEVWNDNQKTWLARYSNGWYRDRKEAAGAYAVFTDRAVIARDRRSLAGADQRRLDAARLASEQIATARGALASLIT
jgi:outer membrane murein-binding lipoprotein Lpp